jgi:hypothetical protein
MSSKKLQTRHQTRHKTALRSFDDRAFSKTQYRCSVIQRVAFLARGIRFTKCVNLHTFINTRPGPAATQLLEALLPLDISNFRVLSTHTNYMLQEELHPQKDMGALGSLDASP